MNGIVTLSKNTWVLGKGNALREKIVCRLNNSYILQKKNMSAPYPDKSDRVIGETIIEAFSYGRNHLVILFMSFLLWKIDLLLVLHILPIMHGISVKVPRHILGLSQEFWFLGGA